jgi:hypothetical protein
MPPRFVLAHICIGALLATVFVATLQHLDLHGIGTLLTSAPEHPGPLLLLWFVLGLTFASVQFAMAIMLHFGEEA